MLSPVDVLDDVRIAVIMNVTKKKTCKRQFENFKKPHRLSRSICTVRSIVDGNRSVVPTENNIVDVITPSGVELGTVKCHRTLLATNPSSVTATVGGRQAVMECKLDAGPVVGFANTPDARTVPALRRRCRMEVRHPLNFAPSLYYFSPDHTPATIR